jgi:hypothetical protein
VQEARPKKNEMAGKRFSVTRDRNERHPPVIKNEITSENIRRRSKNDDDTDDDAWKLQEGHMYPACIASTAVLVAGAGSAGGILAVCIGKFRKVFRASGLGLFRKMKEK